jgi:hypothetical protein
MEDENDYKPGADLGRWSGRTSGNKQEIEEHAAHYAELHPDPPTPTSLTSMVSRVAARLRGTSGRGRSTAKKAAPPKDVWAEEEALYRAKDEGEPHA